VCWRDAIAQNWIVVDPNDPTTLFDDYLDFSEGASEVEDVTEDDLTD